ncbi:MAG: histidine phosphatase family protein [Acholeplasma sp.]|nr:MAG: histidine phosphatase family protein [Acholeplasma sp.]
MSERTVLQTMEVILIRHGEPRYDEVQLRGYVGMGFELGKLTDQGMMQAARRAADPILKDATLIITSPYTRALQTAAIISRLTQIPLVVENDVHEWMPDTTFTFNYRVEDASEEYWRLKGKDSPEKKYHWETYEHLKERVRKAILNHQDHEKVIVVCHGIVMSTLTHFDDIIEHCGVRQVTL